jgi:hypothetical protein
MSYIIRGHYNKQFLARDSSDLQYTRLVFLAAGKQGGRQAGRCDHDFDKVWTLLLHTHTHTNSVVLLLRYLICRSEGRKKKREKKGYIKALK